MNFSQNCLDIMSLRCLVKDCVRERTNSLDLIVLGLCLLLGNLVLHTRRFYCGCEIKAMSIGLLSCTLLLYTSSVRKYVEGLG